MLNVTDCDPPFQLPLPGCDAVNVQSPAVRTVTEAPDTVHTPVVDDEYENEPPPVASVEAEAVKFESPKVLPPWLNVTVWFFFAIAKVTDCEPLFQLPLPGCDAVNVQLPADTTETVAPETAHTPVVEDE